MKKLCGDQEQPEGENEKTVKAEDEKTEGAIKKQTGTAAEALSTFGMKEQRCRKKAEGKRESGFLHHIENPRKSLMLPCRILLRSYHTGGAIPGIMPEA